MVPRKPPLVFRARLCVWTLWLPISALRLRGMRSLCEHTMAVLRGEASQESCVSLAHMSGGAMWDGRPMRFSRGTVNERMPRVISRA